MGRALLSAWLLLAVAAALLPALDSSPLKMCPDEFITVLAKLHRKGQKMPPQLTFNQMLWIASILRATQAQTPDRPLNFLVFGLGADTPGWLQINCKGRTVFLENSAEWTRLVRHDIARDYNHSLEAYTVSYKGKMTQAQDFYAKPWLMDVPYEVSSACYEVILVDAPNGFNPAADQPGRMESTYFAIQQARRCLEEGRLPAVHIFLHDMNRDLEQEIAAKYLSPAFGAQHLGTLKGWLGNLAGYTVHKKIG